METQGLSFPAAVELHPCEARPFEHFLHLRGGVEMKGEVHLAGLAVSDYDTVVMQNTGDRVERDFFGHEVIALFQYRVGAEGGNDTVTVDCVQDQLPPRFEGLLGLGKDFQVVGRDRNSQRK